MLKMRPACLLGLATVSAIVTLSASPVKAESKVSQCKRFYQTMQTFTNQLNPGLKQTMQAKTPETFTSSLDRVLNASQRGLKQIEGRKFSDPNLQTFQNQALNIYTNLHNAMAKTADAVDGRNKAAFDQSRQKLKAIAQQEEQFRQQVMKYCKSSAQ
jgi:hypothetical protein